MHIKILLTLGTSIVCLTCRSPFQAKIDRYVLVTRHNVTLTNVDTLGSLSVGNGEFAFTVDVSGLQTFPNEYENGIPLGTQAQWAWHRIPSEKKYSLRDVVVPYASCDSSFAPYPVQHNSGEAAKATQQLRANPHRLHLGLVGLQLTKKNGETVALADLQDIHQELNLWTGGIESSYEIEGTPVRVLLYSDPNEDGIAVKIQSALITSGRLKVKLDFPYGKECHTCAGYDFANDSAHQSILTTNGNQAAIKRQVDSTRYNTYVAWKQSGTINENGRHHFLLTPSRTSEVFEFVVSFNQLHRSFPLSSDFNKTQDQSSEHWKNFWLSGAVVDFSECTDKRAFDLERRIILSQYLTRIQCAGTTPPQETGLTMNSWFGKFHLEMHAWHAAQFALWGRPELLEKSMWWYKRILPKAKATAAAQGYKGARWPKMTDPSGAESPSSVGAFIIWQQPHPIYMAELLYRSNPTKETLERYQELVAETANFMVSFLKRKDDAYHLCHPLIPAQEIFSPSNTDDPTFELEYWYYALRAAQIWQQRLGLPENSRWKETSEQLVRSSIESNLYLPVATAPNAYKDSAFRRDHPSVMAALGFIPATHRIDTTVMTNTLRDIMTHWQWNTTWGWDYPMLAMAATRLHQPRTAVDALLMDVPKNTYLINGHNYQDKRLRLYLPGNGGVLAAVALMTAGWDGNTIHNPGFPKDGTWNVKWEGVIALP